MIARSIIAAVGSRTLASLALLAVVGVAGCDGTASTESAGLARPAAATTTHAANADAATQPTRDPSTVPTTQPSAGASGGSQVELPPGLFGPGSPPEQLTTTQWIARLSPPVYRILREKGTERAFTSPLNDEKRAGVFACAGCDRALFHSSTKFDSGTGWPSFYQPIDPTAVKDVPDHSLGMIRTETVCSRCDGHLGHVFPDGPPPTGLRYCINGLALRFVPTN